MKSTKMSASKISQNQDLVEEMVIWGFFHDLFRIPSYEQWTWLHEERVDLAWSLLSAQSKNQVVSRFPLPAHYDQYEQEYLSAFEIGAPEPACPLIESYWSRRGNAAQVIHENMLYYQHFGLKLNSSNNEAPDHLRHQLEFMQYLCRIEKDARESGQDESATQSIQRGREDFVFRHLAGWVWLAADKLAEKQPDAWSSAWMALLAAWCSKKSSN